MFIKLVRHGESLSNTGEIVPSSQGDYSINLTKDGVKNSLDLGQRIGRKFVKNSQIYCSPYFRARQTLDCIFKGLRLVKDEHEVFEDPRLREVERGYWDERSQFHLRKIHGWFYYRHFGGESPADCYDRVSSFLESMMRQMQRSGNENFLIVTHGMIIRCFVMRFLHLKVEDFERMKNPLNCDIVTIAPRKSLSKPSFFNKKWAVCGIRLR